MSDIDCLWYYETENHNTVYIPILHKVFVQGVKTGEVFSTVVDFNDWKSNLYKAGYRRADKGSEIFNHYMRVIGSCSI